MPPQRDSLSGSKASHWRRGIAPVVFTLLLLVLVLPAWRFLLARDLRASAKERGPDGREAPFATRASEPVDAAMLLLHEVTSGAPSDLEALATERLRRELPQFESLLSRIDLDQVRVLHRVRNAVQIEAPILDPATRAASGRQARMRLVKDEEAGAWKLDHVRIEGK